jgi:photosystem II stability/assembly factor-like uncharacterized protein
MRLSSLAAVFAALLCFGLSRPGFAARPPAFDDTGGVLRGLSIASFKGASQDSIQAAATDSNGNIYVAGTTYSSRFPVKNAAQPAFGDAEILRTTDLGTTWSRAGTLPCVVTLMAADPAISQVLFASCENGIYKSPDAGQTWQLVYSQGAGSLAIDPGNHLRVAATAPALIRSLDGGETWTSGGELPCLSGCGGSLIADPTGSGKLLVSRFGLGLAISNDWGLTFQPLAQPPGNGLPSAVAFDPSHPGWIYVDMSVGTPGTLSLSTDYGSTWTVKTSPPTTFSAIEDLAVDPDQPNTLVAATVAGSFYKSPDGAASWTLQTPLDGPPAEPPFIAETRFVLVRESCSPSGGLLSIGNASFSQAAAAFSPNFGMTWRTPQLTGVTSLASGPSCTFYVTRTPSSDVFVAKLRPDGATLWATRRITCTSPATPVRRTSRSRCHTSVRREKTRCFWPSSRPRGRCFIPRHSAARPPVMRSRWLWTQVKTRISPAQPVRSFLPGQPARSP